ncbi:hypothetical protein [Streptomyces sp. SID14515]|uniref:hypothetical protein n=1 Tax=Streptomyces sp. SID14515 TaxID=2706074 RepID=UPI0013C5B049|nr:hypothetical protein [Streptomyces sp. SID14515]NEB40194.1 hypothetical protein [Streptomyces sp. SID14515]
MSTLTTNVRTLRGPSRVLLRVHRRTLWAAGAVAAAVIVGMIAVALVADQVAADFAATGCTLLSTADACMQPARDHADRMFDLDRMLTYVGLALIALPAVIGAFVAGPMVAREWESNNVKLSWTQSSPPAAWLTARLAVPAVLVVCGITLLSVVLAWSRARLGRPYPTVWHDVSVFGASGTVPAAGALMSLALGTLAGLTLRRTVPAMAVSLSVSGLVTVALGTLRDSLWPAVRDTFEQGDAYLWPDRAAIVEWGWVTNGGDLLPAEVCTSSPLDLETCLSEYGVAHGYLEYHPASHYWPLQLVETGILLALAALAVFAAFRVLRRLHG